MAVWDELSKQFWQRGEVFLTADHGNAERMFDDDGGPYTAHTNNVVPYIMISHKEYEGRDDGALCDIAPTLLMLMGMEAPPEMTGETHCHAERIVIQY